MDYTAIVILNYNNYKDTINCINSVKAYNTAKIKFFVVDNASPDKQCVPKLDSYFKDTFKEDYLRINYGNESDRKTFPTLTFITSEVNDGYACGNNKALQYLNNDPDIEYVLILNNDILFVQDIIPGLIENLKHLEKAAIVSPLLYKKDMKGYDLNCARKTLSAKQIFLQFLFFLKDPFHIGQKINYNQKYINTTPDILKKESFEIQLPSGSCMLLNKRCFNSIGWFDSHTFLYYEENILNKKLEARGLKCYLIPNLKCIHLGASSTKSSPGYFMVKSSAESAIYYIDKYTSASRLTKLFFKIYLRFFMLPVFKLAKNIQKGLRK